MEYNRELKDEYFNWIINQLFNNKTLMESYLNLLIKMSNVVFIYTLELDENRVKDAQDLRYTFANDCGYSEAQICQELDIEPPSILEVICALILRVQENILKDYDEAITNEDIFMDILKSLGIDDLKDCIYEVDARRFYDVMYTLFTHGYSYNGYGGMFTVNRPKGDMRETEIWYQCMWYLNEKIGGKYL